MATKQTTKVTDSSKVVAAQAIVPVVQKTPTELVASQTYTKLNRTPLPAGVRAFAPDQKITIIASSNPKQPGKMAHARFELYYTMPAGFSVGDYIKASKASGLPGSKAYAAVDVVFDSDHGYIRVEPLAPKGGK